MSQTDHSDLDRRVDERARYWSTSAVFDDATRAEIRALVESGSRAELRERFGAQLEFGTGGLRGVMGAGDNRVNEHTIGQATEGLARWLDSAARPGSLVVIGHDSRRDSDTFSRVAAEVLAAHGYKTLLYSSLAPTPQVSYEVLRRGAAAGIILTASHNPPEYNGYKVYGPNGGQVVPPDDEAIIARVRGVERYEDVRRTPFARAEAAGLVEWLGEASDRDYVEAVLPLLKRDRAANANLGVVYTPLHGTGVRLVPRLLAAAGFGRVRVEPEQAKPDGAFPTVKSPNPEDARAFERAIAFAGPDDHLILANDPDADRLGVMVRGPASAGGAWTRLNGNQIGVLLLDHRLETLRASGAIPANGALVISSVSTPMAAKVARAHGLRVVETLTGFKWIWDVAERMRASGEGEMVFGMEESHGYLAGRHCGDKDGVWAAAAFAEVAADCLARGESPVDRLERLYARHGRHLDDLATLTLPGMDGQARIAAMMDAYRANPPATLGGEALARVVDLKTGAVRALAQARVELGAAPDLPSSNVLIFETVGGSRVIVRPSGTEPKIKFYFNLAGGTAAELEARLEAIKAQVLAA